jgi:hypothetical protein
MNRASLLVLGSVLAATAAACGSDARPAGPSAPPPSSTVPPTAEAQPRGPDDLVVATVAGRPVYASCVQAQAEHLGLDVRAALDQCVDFELLAQAADARGLRADPDVIDAWRREMARAVIRAELTPITKLGDLPPEFVEPLLARRGKFLHRPVIRLAHFVVIDVPKHAVLDGPEDTAAREAAERVYADLAFDQGVLPDELFAATDRHTAGLTVTRSKEPYPTPATGDSPVRAAVPPFRNALYAIPEIGMVSPPVRTQWGWNVILWWDTWPEADLSASFFLSARQTWFQRWADQLGASLGLQPWIDQERLAGLAEDAP